MHITHSVRNNLVAVAIAGGSLRQSPGNECKGARLHASLKCVSSSLSRLVRFSKPMSPFQIIKGDFLMDYVSRFATHKTVSMLDQILRATQSACPHCNPCDMRISRPIWFVLIPLWGLRICLVSFFMGRRRLWRIRHRC